MAYPKVIETVEGDTWMKMIFIVLYSQQFKIDELKHRFCDNLGWKLGTETENKMSYG